MKILRRGFRADNVTNQSFLSAEGKIRMRPLPLRKFVHILVINPTPFRIKSIRNTKNLEVKYSFLYRTFDHKDLIVYAASAAAHALSSNTLS